METRRFLLAIALSVGVLILWGYLFPPEQPQPQRQPPATEAAPQSGDTAPAPPAPAPPPRGEETAEPAGTEATAAIVEATPSESSGIEADAEERVVVDNDLYRAVFVNRGAQLTSFLLKQHTDEEGAPLDLVRERGGAVPYPFGLVEAGGEPSPLNDALFQVDRSSLNGHEEITFSYRGAAGTATKSFVVGEEPLFEVEIDLPDRRGESVVLGPGIRNPTAKELENRFARKSAIYQTPEDTEKLDPNRKSEPEYLPGDGVRWVGLQDTYFLTALVFREPAEQVQLVPMLGEAGPEGTTRFRPRPEELSEAEEDLLREMAVFVRPRNGRLEASAFWGPKIYDDLDALSLGLEESVELGPFGFLARPLLYGLRWIHANLVSNYGWAIILMTLAIRIVLFPLNHKSVVSMQRMQEVNPKIQAIRQKYRSKLKDKQGRPNSEMQRKQNEEIMALYKTEGINPAGGCLPLLLQIPVLFAFYSLLSTAIELRLAPWMGWIQDLSAPDPYLALPIVMGATQFLQQKLTPSAADPAQRRIFMLMPIFFTILFLGFPSGLVLYWLTNNVLGIAQQVAYTRMKAKKAA